MGLTYRRDVNTGRPRVNKPGSKLDREQKEKGDVLLRLRPEGRELPRLIRKVLEEAGISDPERVSTGVDVVGDIAIVRLPDLGGREERAGTGAHSRR